MGLKGSFCEWEPGGGAITAAVSPTPTTCFLLQPFPDLLPPSPSHLLRDHLGYTLHHPRMCPLALCTMFPDYALSPSASYYSCRSIALVQPPTPFSFLFWDHVTNHSQAACLHLSSMPSNKAALVQEHSSRTCPLILNPVKWLVKILWKLDTPCLTTVIPYTSLSWASVNSTTLSGKQIQHDRFKK